MFPNGMATYDNYLQILKMKETITKTAIVFMGLSTDSCSLG